MMCSDPAAGGLYQLVNFWCELDLAFLATLALGVILTILFAARRFGEPTEALAAEGMETILRPAELTNRPAYHMGFAIYLFGLLIAYTLICLIGPVPFQDVLANLPEPLDKPALFPVTVAVVLLGVLPNVRYLSQIELSWRQMTHRRAQIPRAVRDLARTLRASEMDPEAAVARVRASPEPAPQAAPDSFFRAPPSAPESQFARLAALMALISAARNGAFSRRLVDANFVDDHLEAYNQLARAFDELVGRLSEDAPNKRGEPLKTVDPDHLPDIDRLLLQASLFLACAAKAATGGARARAAALQEFGFKRFPRRSELDEADLVISAVGLAALVYVAFVFVGPMIPRLLPEEAGAWLMARSWPQLALNVDRLGWLLPFLLSHMAALIAATFVRSLFAASHNWFTGTLQEPQAPPEWRYILAAVAAYLAAWLTAATVNKALYPTTFAAQFEAVWLTALAPAVSAAWFWRGVDAAATRRPARGRALIAAAHVVLSTAVIYIGLEQFYAAFDPLPYGAMAFATLGTALYTGTLAATVFRGPKDRVVLSAGLGEPA